MTRRDKLHSVRPQLGCIKLKYGKGRIMNLWASVSPPVGKPSLLVESCNGSFLRRALLIALTIVISYAWAAQAQAAITFIQQSSATPQSPKSTVPVTFTSAQTAGNLNVVVVGWNDTTATVSSVTDSKGNVYTRAVGPTVLSGQLSQAIYYAKNIQAAAANTNTVTVQFNVAAAYPDIRILEFSGLDTANPMDVTAAATGTTATSSSGAATTTNGNDLIFGANTVATSTSGPGPGFTSLIITSPDGNIAEDAAVFAVGSYSATAPLTSAGPWVMQMVAFRGAAGAPPPPPPGPALVTTYHYDTLRTGWNNQETVLTASSFPSTFGILN